MMTRGWIGWYGFLLLDEAGLSGRRAFLGLPVVHNRWDLGIAAYAL